MKHTHLFFSGLVILSILVVTACSSGGSATSGTASSAPAAPAADAQQVTLSVGNRMSFEPSTFTVRAGEPVQLTLRNDGTMPHDFTLASGATAPAKISAGGGQTASGTFTISQPGTYAFECSIPGHASAGMQGTIVAQ